MFPEDMPLWKKALIALGVVVLLIAMAEMVGNRRKSINFKNRVTAPAYNDGHRD